MDLLQRSIFFLLLAIGAICELHFGDNASFEELNDNDFQERVIENSRHWLIGFYKPSAKEFKEKFAPELNKVAKIVAGIANIGLVDVEKHKQLGQQYDASGDLTLISFSADKKSPSLYKDEMNAQSMVTHILNEIKATVQIQREHEPNPRKEVIKLTAENFTERVLNSDGLWFVKFYDPNCGHSKAFAPSYAKLASAMKGIMGVGSVNMDVEYYEEMGEPYGITRVPTIKIFGADKSAPSEWEGTRTAESLIDSAIDELRRIFKIRSSDAESGKKVSAEESEKTEAKKESEEAPKETEKTEEKEKKPAEKEEKEAKKEKKQDEKQQKIDKKDEL